MLDKIRNGSCEFAVAHGSGGGAQFANAEAADDLDVVAVVLLGNEFADVGQQGSNRN